MAGTLRRRSSPVPTASSGPSLLRVGARWLVSWGARGVLGRGASNPEGSGALNDGPSRRSRASPVVQDQRRPAPPRRHLGRHHVLRSGRRRARGIRAMEVRGRTVPARTGLGRIDILGGSGWPSRPTGHVALHDLLRSPMDGERTSANAADRELVEPPVTVQLRESPRT